MVDVFVDGSVIQVWSKNHLIRTVARAREGRYGRSEPMGYTSMISRLRSVKHQPVPAGGTHAIPILLSLRTGGAVDEGALF